MAKKGWEREPARHALSAKGLKTKYGKARGFRSTSKSDRIKISSIEETVLSIADDMWQDRQEEGASDIAYNTKINVNEEEEGILDEVIEVWMGEMVEKMWDFHNAVPVDPEVLYAMDQILQSAELDRGIFYERMEDNGYDDNRADEALDSLRKKTKRYKKTLPVQKFRDELEKYLAHSRK
jgi:hypothetical protein